MLVGAQSWSHVVAWGALQAFPIFSRFRRFRQFRLFNISIFCFLRMVDAARGRHLDPPSTGSALCESPRISETNRNPVSYTLLR
jgi:hypothetical protein